VNWGCSVAADVPDLQALQDLISSITPLPRYEVRCGPAVITWLRLWLAAPEADAEAGPPWPGSSACLTGMEMITDPELARGEWKILRDGEVTASGRMEIPEFVGKPIEFRVPAFPDVTDRMRWRIGLMPPLPLPAIGLSSIL
jgi:hypothetical protein